MNLFRKGLAVFVFASSSAWGCYFDFTPLATQCAQWGASVIVNDCSAWYGAPMTKVYCNNTPFDCHQAFDANSYRQCPNQPPSASSGGGSDGGGQCKMKGSIIEVDSQSLAEEIDIVGVPYKLVYDSDKVKGRKTWYQARIYLNDPDTSIHSSTVSYTLDVQIAGQSFTTTIPATSPGQYYDFTWDGKDNSGNPIDGTQTANVKITVNYNFSTPNPAPTKYSVLLGTNLLKPKIGGWDFSIHHNYDSIRKVLYKGTSDAVNTQASVRSNGERWIMSDDRTEVYVFDSNLIHARTLNALTGTTKYTFSYDSQSRLNSIEDAFNNETTIQYTGSNPVSITSPYGQITTLSTDSSGHISELINPANEKHEMTYSSDGLLLTFKKPTGAISTLQYDSAGRLTKDSNSTGSELTLTVSESNSSKTITATTAMNRISTHALSKFNGANKRIDTINGVSTTYTENPVTNATTNSATGVSENVTYKDDPRFGIPFKILDNHNISDAGNYYSRTNNETVLLNNLNDPFSIQTYTKTNNVNGKITSTSFDSASHTLTETSPLGRTLTSVINAQEKIVSNQLGSLNPIIYNYDTRGRVSSVSLGGSRITTMTYNPSNGLVASVENALNQVTQYVYDAAGKITKKTLPDNREISFSYDWNGNLTSVTPPGKPVHEMTYTGDDKISEYLPPTILAPNPTATTYLYNDDRDLIQINRPDGQTIQYGYDTYSGKLNNITLPTGNRSFSYSNGKLYSIVTEDYYQKTISYSGNYITYESMLGPSLYSWIQYTYDSNFRVTNENLVSESISYQYDNDGELILAGDMSLARSANTGFVEATNLGNIYQTFTYSSGFGELSKIETEFNNGNVYSEEMIRDLLGRISLRTEQYGVNSPTTYAYSYDSSGRLVEVKLNGTIMSEYGYDLNSNRSSQTVNGVTLSGTSIAYDDQDRLIQFGTKNFSYNANGEVTSKTDTVTSQTINYNYDVLGNLRSVTLPSKTINYSVDANNRRMVKKNGSSIVQSYIWNKEGQLIALTNSSGTVVSRFVYGTKSNVPDYMIQGADKYQIISNHLGSPVVVIHTATGAITQEIKYDEFGIVVSDSSPGFTPFGFAGCLYDHETKLCRFGARDYDASIGRWLSKDPIRFESNDTNLYGYVWQDPINYIDPSGKEGSWIAGFICKATKGRCCQETASEAMKCSIEPPPPKDTEDDEPTPKNNCAL